MGVPYVFLWIKPGIRLWIDEDRGGVGGGRPKGDRTDKYTVRDEQKDGSLGHEVHK